MSRATTRTCTPPSTCMVDKLDRQVIKHKDKAFGHPHDA